MKRAVTLPGSGLLLFFVLFLSLFFCGFSPCFAGPAEVLTGFLRLTSAESAKPSDACKNTLRQLLVEAGVDKQIQTATQNGRFKKRYLLKIAHNNGAGVDGFRVNSNGEMPGYIWAVTKSLLKFFQEALQEPLSDEEKQLMIKGEGLAKGLLALAPAPVSPRNPGSGDGQAQVSGRRLIGVKLIGSTVKLILHTLTRTTRTRSWNVVGYPAVSNPAIVAAWAELVREWGGEPWVGDDSGIESPDTLENMKQSGIYDAALKSGARLWVFSRGVLGEPRKGGDAVFIPEIDGQRLDAFETITSEYLADYPDHSIGIPSPIVKGFFAGIFFEAHPKAHVLSVMTGAVKNLVGLMSTASRRAMHNMSPQKSPWGVVGTHNSNSNRKIAQTAYAVTRVLGAEIIGYIGDSVSTITAIGPDTGPHTVFKPADHTITFSRNLFLQETSTLTVSTLAAQHLIKSGSKHPRLQFNTHFRAGDPLADETYRSYAELALQENPDLTRFSWKFIGFEPDAPLISEIRDLAKTHLASFRIEVQEAR